MKKNLLVLLLFVATTFTAWSQQKVKVACVGNSITYGLGIKDRDHDSYPAKLQVMLGDGYEVGNFGKSGATLLDNGHRPYRQQEEYKQAIDFAGDIVVIHLGVNDTDPRNFPNYQDEFIPNYMSLIEDFRKVNPKARILIAKLSPIKREHPRFLSGTRDWEWKLQDMIEVIARNSHVQLIDFHTPLYAYPWMYSDIVHPNEAGLNELAKVVYKSITGNFGGLQMGPLYTDNMVLQHGEVITIEGIANANDKVTVSIAGQKLETVTADNGKWNVNVQPLKAGGPYELKIATKKQKLVYHNVLAGEVWLCSGQSNMAFMESQCTTLADDLKQADKPVIRLFNMQPKVVTDNVEWPAEVLDSLNYLYYYKPTAWSECSAETVKAFSAVGYHFGKTLNDSLNIPIGLINNSIGGSTTSAWISRKTLEFEMPNILPDWLNNDFIQDWARGRAKKNIAKSPHKFQRHPYESCYLFETGIEPLQHYHIKGVIWYQGESNAHNIENHEDLFRLLVKDWRGYWNNNKMPFYYVQLSSLNRPSWPRFRDSQRKLMYEFENVGMAVCTDVGDTLDVHPRNKKPVGERLAAWALNQTYGHHNVPSGPLFREVTFQGATAIVEFDYSQGLTTNDGQPVRTFELAGDDLLYYPAIATIQGDKVVVKSDKVKNPTHVRYGWQPFTRANLVNGVGYPASTFLNKD